MFARWTCVVAMLSCFSACAGMQHQTRSAHDEAAEPLTQGQLTEVAGVLDTRGDVVRAEQYWRLALEQGADAETVLPKLLGAFVRDRQYRLALQHAQEYLRAHPNAYTLRLLAGAIYEAVGNYPAAIEQYQIVAERRAERADVHYVLGAALLKQGTDRMEADACFRRYLELAPEGRYAERAQASLLKEMVQ
jgi:tetratricopeptide (TPR) repeat protein